MARPEKTPAKKKPVAKKANGMNGASEHETAAAPRLSADQLKKLYRAMLRIRTLDERMITLQRQGRVGFYGACTGQEAATIASAYALNASDWIFQALRELVRPIYVRRGILPVVAEGVQSASELTRPPEM